MVGTTLHDVSLCSPVGSAVLPLTVVMETILLTVKCLLDGRHVNCLLTPQRKSDWTFL